MSAEGARDVILTEIHALPVSASRGRVVPRGVKRKMSDFPLRPRHVQHTALADTTVHVITRHRPPTGTISRRHCLLNSIAFNEYLTFLRFSENGLLWPVPRSTSLSAPAAVANP